MSLIVEYKVILKLISFEKLILRKNEKLILRKNEKLIFRKNEK